MNRRKALGATLALIGAIGLALLVSHTAKSGEMQAYFDIVLGKPKYFVSSGAAGPPPGGPAALDAAAGKLASKGVEIVDTGCSRDYENDAYNHVIREHYGLAKDH